jgi:hypothetical protein
VASNAGAVDAKLFSGLYRYDCSANTWTLLREDRAVGDENVELASRIGHSMLHDGGEGALLIFAGQREKKFLSDFYKYSLSTGEVELVCDDCSKHGGPFPGFTQRATIDLQKREAYVLSGLIKSPDTESTKASKVDSPFPIHSMTRCAALISLRALVQPPPTDTSATPATPVFRENVSPPRQMQQFSCCGGF